MTDWYPWRTDQTGNVWEWEYRDDKGTRLIVDPVAHACIVRLQTERDMVRETLIALCKRDGLSLESSAEPGKPAANYELALRLGIGQVFGLGDRPDRD